MSISDEASFASFSKGCPHFSSSHQSSLKVLFRSEFLLTLEKTIRFQINLNNKSKDFGAQYLVGTHTMYSTTANFGYTHIWPQFTATWPQAQAPLNRCFDGTCKQRSDSWQPDHGIRIIFSCEHHRRSRDESSLPVGDKKHRRALAVHG